MLITCFSDIHNMLSMLSMPTVLRRTVAQGVAENLRRFGPADLTLVGGDTVSDYPSYRHSGWLPRRNFLDLRGKLEQALAPGTRDGRILYVAGNHDYACGEGVREGYSTCPYNSADYADLMRRTLGPLPERDVCLGYSERLGRGAGAYLLGFHYEIDGLDFYGLNFHPDDIYSHQGMLPGSVLRYSGEALVWLKHRLRETDPQGDRLTFVVSHLPPFRNRDPQNAALLLEAYRGHRNVFHLFGDTHGIVRNGYTAQQVYACRGGEAVCGQTRRSSREWEDPDYDFTAVLMGTHRCDEAYDSDVVPGDGGAPGLGAHPRTATPLIAQGLAIRTFGDRVEFLMCNQGKGAGGRLAAGEPIVPYTAYLRRRTETGR